MTKYSFGATGTTWFIELSKNTNITKDEIERFVADLESQYSRFRPYSLISTLNRDHLLEYPPDDLIEMLQLGLQLQQLTDGRFNLLSGTILEQRGYDKNFSRLESNVKSHDLRTLGSFTVESSRVSIPSGTSIDLGSLGKGFIVDQLCEYLEAQDEPFYIVNAGGDIRMKVDKQTKFFLESPFTTKEAIGEIMIESNAAIASSSNNRRRWKTDRGNTYAHIVEAGNEGTIAGTYVYAASALIADAASTALFLTPSSAEQEVLANKLSIEYMTVYNDGRYIKSERYPGKLYAH